VKAIEVVEHDHIERRGRGALLLEASHVQVVMIRAAVRQPMDKQRIAVKGKGDWLAGQFNSATTCGVRTWSSEASTTCGLTARWDAVRITLARIC